MTTGDDNIRRAARALAEIAHALAAADQAEERLRALQSLKELDLDGGVGDMILATNDMADLEIDVVHHRRQRVEIGGVLTQKHRIGQGGAVDMAFAADEIVPAHDCGIELETPMRAAARGRKPGALRRGQFEGGAVVDRG